MSAHLLRASLVSLPLVILTACNVSIDTDDFVQGNITPVAVIKVVDKSDFQVAQQIELSGTNSLDLDGSIEKYQWSTGEEE